MTEVEKAFCDHMRGIINANGYRYCKVTFAKRDGSQRDMLVRPAAIVGQIKGTELGQRMGATRAANYPELMSVVDERAHQRGEPNPIRSINLLTMTELNCDGVKMTFDRG